MAIAGYVEKDARVADIGTDHGYLPAYLAQSGLALNIIASDINAGSINTAQNTAKKSGVDDRITFIVAPGLSGIDGLETDTIVLSGMGGETITKILSQAPWTKHRGVRMILQPQTKADWLCAWLRENGYAIPDAKLTRDKGRLYIVMLAQGRALGINGITNSGDPWVELLSLLAGKGDPHFPEYIGWLITKTLSAAQGLKQSGAAGYSDMAKRLEDLMIIGGKYKYDDRQQRT